MESGPSPRGKSNRIKRSFCAPNRNADIAASNALAWL
jgi:hypothetical protein